MQTLLRRQAATIARLTGGGAVAELPWRIHRNTVWRALVDALSDGYPILCQVVGSDYFEMMARAFIADHPPRQAALILYGAEFPDFVGGFAPLPYARDLARLERAWLEAYHAEDAEPLRSAEIAAIDPETLMNGRLILHPSCRFVASPHAIDAIYAMHKRNEIVPLPDRGAHVFISRLETDVTVTPLERDTFEFLAALAQAPSLKDAITRTGGVETALPYLTRAVSLRLFTRFLSAETRIDSVPVR